MKQCIRLCLACQLVPGDMGGGPSDAVVDEGPLGDNADAPV